MHDQWYALDLRLKYAGRLV